MEKNTTKTEVREKIQELLKTLKAEQEKKPLRLVEQLGYLRAAHTLQPRECVR